MHNQYRKLMACLLCLGAILILMQSASSVRAESLPTPDAAEQGAHGLGASQWIHMVNDGLNNTVFSIVEMGGEVYVGGRFTATKDGAVQGLNHIAKFSNGQWEALPNGGLDGLYVRDMVVVGDDLYVAGAFTETADGAVRDLNNIAKFSNGAWSALPNKGLSGQVDDLEVKGTDLYVGGLFIYTADYALGLNNIAKLSGGAWSALPNKGLDHQVRAVKWFKDDLYAGGFFTKTKDGQVTGMHHFAKLKNGTEWVPVLGDGLNDEILTMTVFNNRLVLGGRFEQSADGGIKNLNRIVFWNGTGYERLANDGLNNRVEALLTYDGILYVGGTFIRTFDSKVQDLNYIAMYRNSVWSPLPNNGLSSLVYGLGVGGGSLFAGGYFDGTYDKAVTNSWNIAEMSLGANLKLRQTVSAGNGAREFVVKLNLVNRGPNPAENVKVVDPIPAGYVYVTATTTAGTCGAKKGKVTCNLGTMTVKQSADIEITIRGKTSTPVVNNCAEASSSTYDPNQQNQKACTRIPPN